MGSSCFVASHTKAHQKGSWWSKEKQEHESIKILHSLLEVILRPLSNKVQDGIQVTYADKVIRSYYFRVAARLANIWKIQ